MRFERDMIQSHDTLRHYAHYMNSSLERIAKLSTQTQLPLDAWSEKIVVDIAGGHIGNIDGSNSIYPSFFPWFSTTMSLLGAYPYSIDRQPYEAYDWERTNPRLHRMVSMIDTVEQSHTHIIYDLQQGLDHPDELHTYIQDKYPQLNGKASLVNCSLFLSKKKLLDISPHFGRQIGLEFLGNGKIADTTQNHTIINQYMNGLFTVAFQLLHPEGLFFLNDELFKKVEGRFVLLA